MIKRGSHHKRYGATPLGGIMRKKIIAPATAAFLISLFFSYAAPAQEEEIRPATLGAAMPRFSLPAYQGGEIGISGLEGKNIILVFPRGLAAEDHWCHICPYQYLELAEFSKKTGFQKKNNAEILFILPYGKEKVTEWVEKFPELLADIESWKHPENPEKLDEQGKRRMKMAREYFPKKFDYKEGKIPFPFPILIDSQQKVTKGLGIFTAEWGGSKIEQNIPTIIIADEKGMVRFKYISQNTFDRPAPEYLAKILSCF